MRPERKVLPCAHCNVLPATPNARFCGKCGQPLMVAEHAVKSNAFGGRVTKVKHGPERILYALTVGPLIGIGIGGCIFGRLALTLEDQGALPSGLGLPIAVLSALAWTAAVAYIILADKVTYLYSAANKARKRLEWVYSELTGRTSEIGPRESNKLH